MEKTKELSLIIPVFNEKNSIKELYELLIKNLKPLTLDFEIIFVDDGSHDKSFEIIKTIAQEDSNVQGLRLRKNSGKSAALSAGFDQACGRFIATMDADLQDRPEELPAMIETLKNGYDVVCAWRHQRKDPFFKKILSLIFNKITSIISGLKLHDINCGLKIFRKEVISEIQLYGQLHRYLAVMAYYKGFKITEVKVSHAPRRFGHSKYGLNRVWQGLLDLLTVVFLAKYLKRPLHLFGPTGLFLSLAGFAIVSYITMLRLYYGHIMSRHPLLIGGVLLLIVGVQFISMGLLAEMLTHIHPLEKKQYSITEKTQESPLTRDAPYGGFRSPPGNFHRKLGG